MAALEAPLADWQERQLEGIEWMARHDRRRRRTTAAYALACAGAYAGALAGAYLALRS